MNKFFKTAVKGTRGAFDLSSVMVGVVVIGILGGIIAATLFAIVPWSQDNAAKANLGAIQSAQSAQAHQTGGYTNYKGLTDAKLLPANSKLDVFVGQNSTCYIAVSASQTGKVYYNTDSNPEPKEYVIGTTTNTCADGELVDDSAAKAAGLPPINNFATRTVTKNYLVGYTRIAASSDNTKAMIFGRNNNGSTFDSRTTTDGGATWSAPKAIPTGMTNIFEAASSGDGSIILVGTTDGLPWISRDSGATFAKLTSLSSVSNYGSFVEISDNGQVMHIVGSTAVYTSLDSGLTWKLKATGDFVQDLTASSDGANVAVIANNGRVFASTDSGATWAVKTSPSTEPNYRAIAVSDDGKKFVATTQKKVFVSNDSSATWSLVKTEADADRYYVQADVSRDGTKMVVTSSSKGFLTSTNSGATWIDPTTAEQTYTGSPWFFSKISANGRSIITVMGSNIYNTQFGPAK